MRGGHFSPSYLHLLSSGELDRRVEQAMEGLTECHGCGWGCGANRRAGELGKCRTGELARVSSYGPHLGEEHPLTGCNLACQYCQNYDISQTDHGEELDSDGLAAMMLGLQEYGCHNINLVSPSHVVPQILAATALAAQAGLRLPLVYNSGGYDSPGMLHLLDGVVDIYMPDMKYADPEIAQKYSRIPNYPMVNQTAVKEMHRQVGDLQIAGELAFRGLLVRHLVLPHRLAGTPEIVHFLAENISRNTYLNLMDQYRPAFRAYQFPEIARRITREEYQETVELARQAGLQRLDHLFA
jgi:putative pyruvate formate lyase activating enzyme